MAAGSDRGGRGVPRRAGKKGRRKGGAFYRITFERSLERRNRRVAKYMEKFPLWREVKRAA